MNEYMPHGFCFQWNIPLMGLHMISDFIIAISYFGIPVALLMFARYIPVRVPRAAFYLFAAFIFLCGIDHVFGMVVIYWPLYWTEGYFKAATAVVSFFTMGYVGFVLRRVKITSQPAVRWGGPGSIPDALKLPTEEMQMPEGF